MVSVIVDHRFHDWAWITLHDNARNSNGRNTDTDTDTDGGARDGFRSLLARRHPHLEGLVPLDNPGTRRRPVVSPVRWGDI